MATIWFQGEPIERHLLRQRIAADRLEPLALPLGSGQAKVLIDVRAQDAWLPLAVELLGCLRRLWSIVSAGPGTAERTADEVQAYVLLRTSLLAALRQRQSSARIRRMAQATIPEQLPTSSKLARLTDDDRARYSDAFDQVESDLIVLGLTVGITSDPRTVQGITRAFDEALDRIEHARAQRVLDRALVSGLTSDQIQAYKRRIRILWQRITRQEDYWLAYALQIIARIGDIWNLLGSQDGGWHRHNHDEEAYQGYRHLLLRGLNQPESTTLHALAGDLLPHILPPEGDASGARVRADMPNRLERLRSEIISLAVEQGDPISIDPSNTWRPGRSIRRGILGLGRIEIGRLPGQSESPSSPGSSYCNNAPSERTTTHQGDIRAGIDLVLADVRGPGRQVADKEGTLRTTQIYRQSDR
ncbi:MAG: hypothetical protein QM589_04515 [Thermomicrobiales bacterium]